VNPRRSNVLGVPPSIIQRVVLPSLFNVDMNPGMGIDQFHLGHRPAQLQGFFASNSAVKAWCANTAM
jgi:hypothetical protein